ncbi:hypothetical protein ACF0H5_011073 [Mactra antiquata]
MAQKTIQHKSKQDIDRGWAWVVMIATFLSTALQCVNLFMGGVIHMALLNKFNEGQTKTSLVGALNNGLLCLACPLGGAINKRCSCRLTIVTGAIISTLGFTLSAFMPSLDWLIFTAGTLVGYLYGVTRSYNYSFLASGGFLLIGSALGSISLCKKQKTKTIDANIETSVEDCQYHVKETPENNTLLSK